MSRPVATLLSLLVACADPPSGDGRTPVPADSATPLADCPPAGEARARVMGPGEALPGETAVGTEGDYILQNAHSAFVITEPGKGSTYYHYGGIVADAVAMDGCDFDGEDKLDEVAIVLADIDLADFGGSVLRGFRGDRAEVLSDGSDGGPAIVRVTGADDTYWVVEYTLILAAAASGGKALSEPYGIAVVVDYILEPDSPVLRVDVDVTNTGDGPVQLAVASLLSFGGTLDLYGYAPESINFGGFNLGFGMPWLVATDGVDALAYGVEAGSLAYVGISGIDVALDLMQAGASPIALNPGRSDSRSLFLAVGRAGGTSATEPLAAVNPEPIPGSAYTLGHATARVVDPAGEAVANARVRVQARAPGADWGTVDEATAGADGRFTVPMPVFAEPWEWRILASAPGRHDSAPVEIAVGDNEVVVPISAVGALRHDLRDGEGAPSPARLALVPEGGGPTLDLWLAGEGLAPVPPGTYAFTATRGYEFAPVTGTLTVPEGGEAPLDLSLVQVVDSRGFVSVDTHVHSWDSPDSRVNPADVLLHAAAHGLDIVVHTEHEHIVDRSDLPVQTGLSDFVASITGEEVTATVPEHLTMFPAEPDGSPRGGIVEWYGRDIDELFGLMRARSGGGVNLLNHPSYLREIGWDRILAEPTLDDPTLLGLAPDAALWSWNLDGIEVMNGHGSPFDGGNGRFGDWQSMLNAGHPLVAVGCSDDHGGDEVGFPRTYVPVSTDRAADVPIEEVVTAFQGGAALASAGAFARLSANGAGLGELAAALGGTVSLDLHIEAIPEIDVRFVSIFVNCDEVLSLPATDPDGVVKFSEVLALNLDQDAHIEVAAFGEQRLPLGLPQYNSQQVPRVLTSPIYLDVDGNGVFDAPGGKDCVVLLEDPGR